jgi:hypothetical protein
LTLIVAGRQEANMSTSTHTWKLHLLKQADTLERLAAGRRWRDASRVRLEESVVLGFYDIRKLAGAFLLSPAVIHEPVSIIACPARRKEEWLAAEERIADLYDLGHSRSVAHDLLFLCHQAVHNCVFEPWLGAGGKLEGVYLTSDHQRKVALYGLRLPVLVALFRKVGKA